MLSDAAAFRVRGSLLYFRRVSTHHMAFFSPPVRWRCGRSRESPCALRGRSQRQNMSSPERRSPYSLITGCPQGWRRTDSARARARAEPGGKPPFGTSLRGQAEPETPDQNRTRKPLANPESEPGTRKSKSVLASSDLDLSNNVVGVYRHAARHPAARLLTLLREL